MIHSTSIEHNQLSIPSAIDDELLTCFPDAPGSQPSDSPSIVECYIRAIKLQDILSQVLTSFYHQGSENEGAASDSDLDNGADNGKTSMPRNRISNGGLQKLLDVDDRLDKWFKDLPAHLRVNSSLGEDPPGDSPRSNRSAIFRRQAAVLRARYVNMVLLP